MTDQATLQQLADVKGQLSAVMTMLNNHHASTQQLMQQQHTATNQRIEDLRTAMSAQHTATEKRIDGLSGRVTTLEGNERGTALKTASVSAITSGAIAVVVALLKLKGGA